MNDPRNPSNDQDDKLNRRNTQRSEEGNVMPSVDQSVPFDQVKAVKDTDQHAEERNKRRQTMNENNKDDVEFEPLPTPEEVAAKAKESMVDQLFQEEKQSRARAESTTQYAEMPALDDVEPTQTRERSPTERAQEFNNDLPEPMQPLEEPKEERARAWTKNEIYENNSEELKKEEPQKLQTSKPQKLNNPLYDPVLRDKRSFNFDKVRVETAAKMRVARDKVKSVVSKVTDKAKQLKDVVKDKVNDEFRPKRK